MTNLRVFGYVFNPASFYLCRDASGELQVVIVEVHNTHGERHLYTLRTERRGAWHVASMDKDFYVSPFIDVVGRYTVRVRDDPGSLRIAIDESQDGQPLLYTSLVLRRLRLTDRAVARMLVRHPFITQKTIAAIHLHAWRLWRRGARFHRHGRPRRDADAPAPPRGGDPMSERQAARNGPAAAEPILAGVAQRIGLAAAARIRTGCLVVVLPDGSRRMFGDAQSTRRGEIRIHDSRALVRALLNGETGGGEAYVDGLWSSPDLVALIELGALNRASLALSAGWWRAPTQLARTLAHRARRNTRRQSQRNIAAHYDLGNDFYRLFLDETMTYSSAVFASPDQSLADAQRNKYRLIAEGAGLTRGQNVLEIGTGWGGFALYAAGELGCRVTSITISREQHDLARERVRAAGLEDLVDVQLRDYREISGTYDAIVSIEMLEAVGAEYFETFFRTCDPALIPGGKMSLQSITFPATPTRRSAGAPTGSRPTSSRAATVHPGPRWSRRRGVRSSASPESTTSAPLRPGTLRAWRTRFLERVGAVRALGFDDRFVRMWEYYLALSEAAFATGTTQDLQVVLEKGRGAG